MMERAYGSVDPEVAASWLASIDVSDGTRRDYDLAFRTWCSFVDSCGYDFDGLEEQHVLDFKEYLLAERRLSPAATSLYLNGVRSFYRFAESRGLDNIARNVRGAKAPRGFKKSDLSPSQARELIASFGIADNEKDARDKAVISLMLHTGVRDVEVMRADRGDLGTRGGHEVLAVRGKGRDEADEIVKISPALDRDIRSYLKMRGSLPSSAPLFASVAPRNKGGRLTTRSISRIVKDALKRIGIDDPRYTAHSLRHSAITFALLAGAELEDAQAMARHSDISTTMIYSHHVDRLANAAEDRVAELLD
ncbi:MAG: tyrosine-type recombinase/integrase [Eggerthellaceae bacterium]|nr:tyrosine-type recombinase/integrase [Eggerthellaceae bacterium]